MIRSGKFYCYPAGHQSTADIRFIDDDEAEKKLRKTVLRFPKAIIPVLQK
jgi:hypothetical protein